MVSLSMLLYTSGGTINNVVARASAYAGPPLLIVATLLTVWSLVVYFKVTVDPPSRCIHSQCGRFEHGDSI